MEKQLELLLRMANRPWSEVGIIFRSRALILTTRSDLVIRDMGKDPSYEATAPTLLAEVEACGPDMVPFVVLVASPPRVQYILPVIDAPGKLFTTTGGSA